MVDKLEGEGRDTSLPSMIFSKGWCCIGDFTCFKLVFSKHISSNTKFRLLTALALNTFLGLRTSSFLICWAALELNLVLFLPFIIFSSTSTRAPQGLVYFFIQRVAGLVLFSLFITEFLHLLSTWKELFLMSLFLLKLGGFPFHSWVLVLTSKLNWESVFILLTLQKFLPLFIIVFFLRRSLLTLIRLGFYVLSVQALRAKTLKVLIVFSSIFFMMGVLSITAQSRTNWMILFFICRITLMKVSNTWINPTLIHLWLVCIPQWLIPNQFT